MMDKLLIFVKIIWLMNAFVIGAGVLGFSIIAVFTGIAYLLTGGNKNV